MVQGGDRNTGVLLAEAGLTANHLRSLLQADSRGEPPPLPLVHAIRYLAIRGCLRSSLGSAPQATSLAP